MTQQQQITMFKAFQAFIAQQGKVTKPKASKPAAKQHKQANGKAAVLAAKDKATIKGFNAKGINDVILMDRNDPTKPFNCKPYQAWLSLGQVVQKGQHGVNGLFHVTQTQPLKS